MMKINISTLYMITIETFWQLVSHYVYCILQFNETRGTICHLLPQVTRSLSG